MNIVPLCLNPQCTQLQTFFNFSAGSTGLFGLESLFTINTINSTITGYHCWLSANNLTVVVNPGSVIGDLIVTTYSLATVYQSTLQYGEVYLTSYATAYLYDCQILENVDVLPYGFLAAERVNFHGLVTVLGNLSAADAIYSASLLDFRAGSTVYSVSISQPPLNTTTAFFTNETLSVFGAVFAVTENLTSIEPFPPATVALVGTNNVTVFSDIISSGTPDNDTLLASWNLSSAQSGTYYITLSFGPGQAVSSRTITIGSMPATTGSMTTSPGSSTTTGSTTTTGSAEGSASFIETSCTLIVTITLSLLFGLF